MIYEIHLKSYIYYKELNKGVDGVQEDQEHACKVPDYFLSLYYQFHDYIEPCYVQSSKLTFISTREVQKKENDSIIKLKINQYIYIDVE